MADEVASPILVVEDDPSIQQTIQWALEDAGFMVQLARDGVEGLDRARQECPGLVVLDMGLPRLNGDGFAAGLRGMFDRDVPILLITADGRAADKARRVGAFDFMQKPFDVDDLVAIVRRGLGSA